MTAQNTNPMPVDERFQSALAQGRFDLPRCGDCGRRHFYPRAMCPHCYSANIVWEEFNGKAHVYSFSPLWIAKPVYIVAYIALDDDLVIMANIVNADPAEVRIGQRVFSLVLDIDGAATLMFTPFPDGEKK